MRNLFVFLFMLTGISATAQPKLSLHAGVLRSQTTPNFTSHPDTVNRSITQRMGLTVGFSAIIPLDADQKFAFHPGIFYTGYGSKAQQNFDTSRFPFFYLATEQKINYITMPLNVLYQVPLKGKTKLLLSAGPQVSLFYTGEVTVTSYDTTRKFRETKDESPMVGKGEGYYRTFFLAANAKAGFDFGRVSLLVNYSKGLSAALQQEGRSYKFDGFGVTLGVGLATGTEKKRAIRDADQDGIEDAEDECPSLPGHPLTKGCPDKDGDGIPDKNDQCPDIPGLKKYNGCPIPDTDGDGINDEEDKCPTVRGTKTNNGCPDQEVSPVKPQEQEKVVVNEKAIETITFNARQIQFKFRSADLTTDSYKLLDEIAGLLMTSQQKILVEGHSSLEGNQRSNLALSEERAASVKKYLVQKGISADRINSVGFGSTKPLVKGTSEKANVQNRRVEIKLLD